MKRVFLIFIFSMCAPLLAEVADFTLRGAAAMQRGVLRFGGDETSVCVYLKGGDTIRAELANDFGRIARAEISPRGKVLSCRGSAFMSDADAEKFFLSPLMLSLGFYGHFAPQIAHTCASPDGLPLAVFLCGDGLYVEFSYAGGGRLPLRVNIKSPQFELRLKTVKIFAKK